MPPTQIQLDCRRQMEAKLSLWFKDTVNLYDIAEIHPTTAAADIIGCLTLTIATIARELKIPPLKFCEMLHEMLVLQERKSKNDLPRPQTP